MTGRGRRHLVWAGALAATVVAIAAIGPRGTAGTPLSPRSTGPLGVAGLLDVLAELDQPVEVRAGVPEDDDAVALVIVDRTTPAQADQLMEWVRAGGTLVVADPFSDLAPDLGGVTSIAFTEPTIEPACEDRAAADVGAVAVADGFVFSLPDGAVGCFPRNDGWWMVRQDRGAGQVVSLGGQSALTNQLLGDADNAVFLVTLLTAALPADAGPGAPAGIVVVEGAADPTEGETLADLLPDQVGLALLQVPLAWLALVWWRGRRHGRPVGEDPPVRLDAADTTLAVGNLMQRAGRPAEAAHVIRQQVTTTLRRRLGLPDAVVGDELVVLAADRTGIAPARLSAVLTDPLPTTDDGLVRLADAAARVQQALVRHGPDRPPTDRSPAAPLDQTPPVRSTSP